MNKNLAQLQRAIADSLRGLDSTQTQLRPIAQPEKWSIQQVAQHLCLSYTYTEVAINARLVKGTPTRAKPTLLQRAGQCTLITLGYFPRGRQAPEMVTPVSDGTFSGEDLARSATENLARIDKLLDEAGALFGNGRCINHKILGPLSVGQWSRFHLIHGRHHVKQIEAIRAAHGV